MFIETMFIIAPIWKTSQMSLSGRMGIHGILLSDKKEQGTMLSERSQSQNVSYSMIPFV